MGAVLVKSTYRIPKMDCPSEEKLVRMAVGDEPIELLQFDLTARLVTVFHTTDPSQILAKLTPLNFGAVHLGSSPISEMERRGLERAVNQKIGSDRAETKVLKILLGINALLFVVEISLGFVAQSAGLIADSMDMFADAAVYGVSLLAVGRDLRLQRKAARASGYMQMALAAFALFEVARRFVFGSDPEPGYMMGVAFVALVANATCLWLISKHRDGGVHMKASLIFSANDVIANAGVILAGLLVSIFGSPIPDFVIGLIIAIVVFRGSLSILKISRPSV